MKEVKQLQGTFAQAYANLNTEQKRAVDTIEGPVMVVAGPGTGKTEVLALRIAHILQATDMPASGILCLTFTRAGVTAMRERLVRYIGARATEVRVTTFHSFANSLIEKHFALLDLDEAPTLLDDREAVVLIDELLERHDWSYLRPRGNSVKYFGDLKSLISLLKRERLTAEDFLIEVERDMKALRESPDSISSRGTSKGQLKKEVVKALESLERTREVVEFYTQYEAFKKERGVMDYDDVLENAVALVEVSDDIKAEIRENSQYIHVDEHQDSSGVQNSFLAAVWKEVEQPNIFVVGDDRQLIYGFGGASLSYFEDFKTMFGKAVLITLVQNYRSTAPILALADEMQKSVLTNDILISNRSEQHPVRLSEYSYPRDEVIAAGLYFKGRCEEGVTFEDCALLVPKNRHVRDAVSILRSMGIPVRANATVSLFTLAESAMFRRVLQSVATPFNNQTIAATLFDETANIPALSAHRFIHMHKIKTLSIDDLLQHTDTVGLFDEHDPIRAWGTKLESWLTLSTEASLEVLIQTIGNQLLVDTARGHEALIRRVEIVRTMIHLVTTYMRQAKESSLTGLIEYIDRLEAYGQTIKVAVLHGGSGVHVLTLHGSKGLEYDSVWIAHMNESVLMSSKRMGFALPQSIAARIEERDEAVARRELYVAVTRAKQFCTISYAAMDIKGAEQLLANVVTQIPETYFIKQNAAETEAVLVEYSPSIYVEQIKLPDTPVITELVEYVKNTYTDTKVSVTLLNNFFECPWKWYFRNLLQLPDMKTESLLFGSAVHGAIESLLKNSIPVTAEAIGGRIKDVLSRDGVSDHRVLDRMVTAGVPVVEQWAHMYLKDIAPNHIAERSISFTDTAFPHLKLYGKIDLTEHFPDDTITVTDFKTGSTKTTGVIEKRDEEGRLSSFIRQLAMYSYLLQGSDKNKKIITSRLLFLEASVDDKNKLYSLRIDDEIVDMLKRDIKDYDDAIQNGTWINRPCVAKPFGDAHSACEYCARARSLYGI